MINQICKKFKYEAYRVRRRLGVILVYYFLEENLQFHEIVVDIFVVNLIET